VPIGGPIEMMIRRAHIERVSKYFMLRQAEDPAPSPSAEGRAEGPLAGDCPLQPHPQAAPMKSKPSQPMHIRKPSTLSSGSVAAFLDLIQIISNCYAILCHLLSLALFPRFQQKWARAARSGLASSSGPRAIQCPFHLPIANADRRERARTAPCVYNMRRFLRAVRNAIERKTESAVRTTCSASISDFLRISLVLLADGPIRRLHVHSIFERVAPCCRTTLPAFGQLLTLATDPIRARHSPQSTGNVIESAVEGGKEKGHAL
jgi:hypothetical protein